MREFPESQDATPGGAAASHPCPSWRCRCRCRRGDGRRRAAGRRSIRSAPSRSARPTPTASCSPPTSGSLRSARASSTTRAGSFRARSARTASTWRRSAGTTFGLPHDHRPQDAGDRLDRPGSTRAPAATDYSVAADGPLFSPDGTTLWVPQSTYLLKFSFDPSTGAATQTDAISLCGTGPLTAPAHATRPRNSPARASPTAPSCLLGWRCRRTGQAVRRAQRRQQAGRDRHRRRHSCSTRSRSATRPRQVVLAATGTIAYVSNEGGRPARPGDFTNLSDGTPIVSSRVTGGAITGHRVGRQPATPARRSRRSRSACSRPRSTRTAGAVRRQLQRRQPLGDRRADQYGHPDGQHQPGAGRDGRQLRERDLDVATRPRARQHRPRQRHRRVQLPRPVPRRCGWRGCIPTDWYPVQVQPDPALGAATIVVTNDKGIGARGPASTINKGPDTGAGRHRSQHLRRHRQRDRRSRCRPQPDLRHLTQHRLHRQRLEADPADQPGRLRHRAEGHPARTSASPRRSSTSW